MNAVLHRNAVVTFRVEDHQKKWKFDKVLIIPISGNKAILGRSCTSDNHPFHIHPDGFAKVVHSENQTPIECPFFHQVLEWSTSKPNATIGAKERRKRQLENEMERWFKELA